MTAPRMNKGKRDWWAEEADQPTGQLQLFLFRVVFVVP